MKRAERNNTIKELASNGRLYIYSGDEQAGSKLMEDWEAAVGSLA